MAVYEPATVLEYSAGQDPKQVVFDAILPLIENFHLYRNEVLVVTAPNNTQSAGGIIMPEQYKKEQRFQGKIGLVVALGEIAFNDKDLWPNEETRPKVGTWVFFRTADTNECSIGGYSCRFVDDHRIRGCCPAADTLR
jgi:co-chaperonin GroES (HSP10)